jgi:two-component system, OmpR family, response regulator RegX3
MRIAVLEDEKDYAEHVAELLRRGGHTAHTFNKGRALLRELRAETFDLIVLDWEIPDVSGIDVLRTVRKNLALTTPIVFLTHRDSESDVVDALEAGADDFLIKPARERELLARVDAVGRRLRPSTAGSELLELGPFRLDLLARRLDRNGELLELTRREFEVAALLFQNVDRVLSRGHILDAVWGNSSGGATRTVDMHVSRVRKILGLSSAIGVRLSAVYGYGYRLEVIRETPR